MKVLHALIIHPALFQGLIEEAIHSVYESECQQQHQGYSQKFNHDQKNDEGRDRKIGQSLEQPKNRMA